MSIDDVDHGTLFLRNYERYEAAKQRGESKDISRFSLLALNQIHLISGVSAAEDRDANFRVMHRLLPILSESEVRQVYDQLRGDAGIE
jgi:hypothetical protein